MFIKDSKETIVALATAAGTAAIAVIRLSGKEAITISDRIFKFKNKNLKTLLEVKSHTLHFGNIMEGDRKIDEVLLSVMKSPNSYTGEDIVEISCHGSPFIQKKIISLCQEKGAVLAGPGEFTLRAFLNGKLDLTQAEAVADLIAADSSVSHQLAVNQIRGGYSQKIKLLRNELIQIASLIELELDFAEEDVEFANKKQLKDILERLDLSVEHLLKSFEAGNVIKNGIPVIIAGLPNAGKSTLLNSVLKDDRAIVSHIPGTTRDTIEEEIFIDGIKFRFVDTAGIREGGDEIELIGIKKSYEKITTNKLILYVFDINTTSIQDLETELEKLKEITSSSARIIPVANKIDLLPHDFHTPFEDNESVLFISAKNNFAVDELIKSLSKIIESEIKIYDETIVSNIRHADALRKTHDILLEIKKSIDLDRSHDFLAQEIRIALHYLGEITGEITTEDILDNIFSKFCIGK